jgi:hypothetical protein
MRQTSLDAEVKGILRDAWSQYTTLWGVDAFSLSPNNPNMNHWLRAQPVPSPKVRGQTTSPRIVSPGMQHTRTQPDGMWIQLSHGADYVNVIVIEACATSQNLNDKRSRYRPSIHAKLVEIRKGWLEETVGHKNTQIPRKRLLGVTDQAISASWHAKTATFPVRHLGVLYTLPESKYQQWLASNPPDGHEYFCTTTSLRTFTAAPFRRFLQQLAPSNHYYTT